jgi:hypothetical protein
VAAFEIRSSAACGPGSVVESPESNGMAEAFVKAFKRDFVRVNSIQDADAALA